MRYSASQRTHMVSRDTPFCCCYFCNWPIRASYRAVEMPCLKQMGDKVFKEKLYVGG